MDIEADCRIDVVGEEIHVVIDGGMAKDDILVLTTEQAWKMAQMLQDAAEHLEYPEKDG